MRGSLVVLFTAVQMVGAPLYIHAQSPGAPQPHLEGDWVRVDPDGVNSFDGLSAVVPPAQLLPGVSAAAGRGGGRGR